MILTSKSNTARPPLKPDHPDVLASMLRMADSETGGDEPGPTITFFITEGTVSASTTSQAGPAHQRRRVS